MNGVRAAHAIESLYPHYTSCRDLRHEEAPARHRAATTSSAPKTRSISRIVAPVVTTSSTATTRMDARGTASAPTAPTPRLPRKTGPHQHHVPGTVIPADLSKQISHDILNRLNRALDRTLDNQAHNHAGPGTNTNGRARLETRGPQPGQKPGDYEPNPYPKAAHTLGLAPLIDQAPPF